MLNAKKRGETSFFVGNRRKTCRSLHYSTFTSRARTLDTTGVHSTYHESTLGIPRDKILHKLDFWREIDVKRTNATISLLLRHRAVLYKPRMYNLHTTSVQSTRHGCTLCISRMYTLLIAGLNSEYHRNTL